MNVPARKLLAALDALPPVADSSWVRLRNFLETHADTEFGKAHGFESIRNASEFRESVPVMNYDDHRNWITRSAAGEARVLACDEPVGFERTSGTSSEMKWIPLTPGLQREFASGLAGWFGGWKTRRPEVFDGRAYWALSPPGMATETTAGGLPVGMTHDAAYFPEEIGEKLAEWLVVPNFGDDPSTFFEETAEALLGVPDLSVVSVWSPTFLLGIDSALRRLRGGKCWSDIWPRLALVSCWADGSSAPWIPALQKSLGKVPIEAKGLLATEGVTSLPDAIDGSPRLATECHWHEFIDAKGRFTEIESVVIGRSYEVLLTTSGGLFRYRSGDRVQVTGIGCDGLPRLRFLGRSAAVCDLVGEKLHEEQVVDALVQSGARGVLVADRERPGYDLWLDDPAKASAVEAQLRRNLYFEQALALGQLAPVRVKQLAGDWALNLTAAMARCRGCRIGDVKVSALLADSTSEEVASWLG